MTAILEALLTGNDPEPVLRVHSGGTGAWLLVSDHAGSGVPEKLRGLGMAASDLADHIGVDIGIWPVTRRIAADLAAPAIGQAYSRLVIDCNRRPGSPASIPTVSDGRAIPGNHDADAATRVREIFHPYHDAIEEALEPRTMLCAMHSFTRVLGGHRRSVDIGIIYGTVSRLADRVIEGLAGCGLNVARNAPYKIDFVGDYTCPVHGEARGLDYVEIEICQDLITTAHGQAKLAGIISGALRFAQDNLS